MVRMTFRRPPPPPPKSDPPSVLLMRAIGDLQAMEGGEPITDTDTIALMCGIVWVDLATLIEVGIKGQRWYDRDLLRRE